MGSLAKSMGKKFSKITSLSVVATMLLGSVPVGPAAAATVPQANANVAAGTSHLISYEGAAYASSNEGGLTPDKAFDNNLTSRWGSSFSADPQWIYVDLGASASIDRVILRWENAYAKSYKLQVSDNEADWKDIYVNTASRGGVETIDVKGQGRYVRMLALERSGNYGVSLYEFEVYGTGGTNPQPVVLGPDVALNKPVVASSFEIAEPKKPLCNPENIVDGDNESRWSSKGTSDEWIYVDLGSVHTIGRVRLLWENALAVSMIFKYPMMRPIGKRSIGK